MQASLIPASLAVALLAVAAPAAKAQTATPPLGVAMGELTRRRASKSGHTGGWIDAGGAGW
jgi:hypothetical protein